MPRQDRSHDPRRVSAPTGRRASRRSTKASVLSRPRFAHGGKHELPQVVGHPEPGGEQALQQWRNGIDQAGMTSTHEQAERSLHPETETARGGPTTALVDENELRVHAPCESDRSSLADVKHGQQRAEQQI